MAEFEIIEREGLRQVKITLNNETIRAESGALYYMRGQIEMESKGTGGVGGFFKSLVTGEDIFRPRYTGSGELYLEPSFDGFHILELKGDEWVMDTGGYWASEGNVEISARRNSMFTGLFGGEGLFQTTAKGYGKLVLVTPGAIEAIKLQNNRLMVDGTFAVARTGGLNYRMEKATKSLLGSFTSGEGFVNIYEGTGTVLLATNIYRRSMMVRKIQEIIAVKESAAYANGKDAGESSVRSSNE